MRPLHEQALAQAFLCRQAQVGQHAAAAGLHAQGAMRTTRAREGWAMPSPPTTGCLPHAQLERRPAAARPRSPSRRHRRSRARAHRSAPLAVLRQPGSDLADRRAQLGVGSDLRAIATAACAAFRLARAASRPACEFCSAVAEMKPCCTSARLLSCWRCAMACCASLASACCSACCSRARASVASMRASSWPAHRIALAHAQVAQLAGHARLTCRRAHGLERAREGQGAHQFDRARRRSRPTAATRRARASGRRLPCGLLLLLALAQGPHQAERERDGNQGQHGPVFPRFHLVCPGGVGAGCVRFAVAGPLLRRCRADDIIGLYPSQNDGVWRPVICGTRPERQPIRRRQAASLR